MCASAQHGRLLLSSLFSSLSLLQQKCCVCLRQVYTQKEGGGLRGKLRLYYNHWGQIIEGPHLCDSHYRALKKQFPEFAAHANLANKDKLKDIYR